MQDLSTNPLSRRLSIALISLSLIASLSACQPQNDNNNSEQAPTEKQEQTNPSEQKEPDTTPSETDTPTDGETKNTKEEAKEEKTEAAISEVGAIPEGYQQIKPLSEEVVRTFDNEPRMALQEGKDYYALLDTSKGQIVIDLFEQETPVTVNNFVALARNNFYNKTRFHRVIDGFMAQAGDPKSADLKKKSEWGTGDPGYKFADEIRQKLTFDGAGLLAMANSGPNTNGSQFFITFEATPFLNGKHTIFGKVVKGEDILQKLTRTMDQGNADISDAKADDILSIRILTK